jgi:hypothetical protein
MKNIILAAICLLAISCSSAEKFNYFDGEIKVYDSFLIEDELSVADTLPMPESVIGIGGIQVIDSMLLIHKPGQATNLSILNLNNGQISENIAYTGRGPNEYSHFLTYRQFVQYPDKICLHTFNDDLSAMLLNVTESWKQNKTIIEEKKNIGGILNYFCQGLYFLSDGSMFAKYRTSYKDARDMFFYPAEYALNPSGEKEIIPFFGKDIPTNPEMSHFPDFLYSGITRIKPDGTRAVDGMFYMDYINFIDLKKKEAFGVRNRNAISYEEFTKMSREEFLERNRYCYNDLSVTNDYILALYRGDKSGQTENFENMHLRIFDWNGTPLASLKPDHPLFCIAFDERTNQLYASNLEDQIFIYDLNEILEKIRRETGNLLPFQ